jgi:hypothetical protein
MLGEATLHVSGTFAGEAIRLPIQIAALHACGSKKEPAPDAVRKIVCQAPGTTHFEKPGASESVMTQIVVSGRRN